MLKQRKTAESHKYNRFPLWKQMALVIAILFSGGALTTLVPSQAAYAHSNRSNIHHHTGHKGRNIRKESIKLLIVCQAGNGGQGGAAMKKSSGANGGAGGSCNITVPIKVFLTIQRDKHHK